MQQSGNPARFVPNQPQNQQHAAQNKCQATSMLSNTGAAASQPPPYPGTQTLPSMGHTFSQRPAPYSELQSNPAQYQTVYPVQGAPGTSRIQAPVNSPSLSPGAIAMQGGRPPLSPSSLVVPRKSLAGMISPIKQQSQPVNMLPPTSPMMLGGRLQMPVSPHGTYMSQPQSAQRMTAMSHVRNVSPRTYPPQSPVYRQNPASYNFVPQPIGSVPRSPVPSSLYVDPGQHHQLSPMIPRSPHHSPQPIGPQLQMSRSPYKAARQLNMAVSPGKPQRFVQPGEQNQGHWQQSTHPGQKIWENINVAPLPVLSSETLNLLSTLTVSTVSSPVQVSPSTVAADSQMPKSTLLQKHLMMPPTPIRNMKQDNLLVIADRSTVADASVNNNLAKPPSRSDSMKTARLTRSHLSEKKTTESATFSTSSTVATPTSVVTPMKTDVTATTKEMSASHEAGTERRSPVEQTDAHSMYQSADSCHDHTADSKNDASNVDPEIIKKRLQLCEIYRTRLQEKLDLYKEYLTELFFLRNGGNIMDYVQFKKRPSAKLLEYLKSKLPDIRAGADNPRKISQDSVNSSVDPASPASDASSTVVSKRSHSAGKGIRNRSVSHDDTEIKSSRQKAFEKTGSKNRSRSRDESRNAEHRVTPQMKSLPVSDSHQVINDSPKNQSQLLKKLVKQGTPAQLDDSIGSQEEILERAKQEAVIQRKVVELRKQGLWTQRRLPKVQEPPRSKTHWDYLLEEMRWLAADFAQERKWKRAAARKLARAVTNFHKEQHDQERRAKREEQNRLRRIASTMAREIRVFWGNIGKVVEYKQRSLLDEKRQKALDMHLSYIVDQTEKYSDWLTKGLNKPAGSVGSDSPTSGLKQGSDDEFLPQGQSSDDEETIAVAEQALEKSEEEKEVSLLKKESELPFEELLSTLPPELIENIGKPLEEAKPSASSVTEQPTDEKPLAVAQSSDEDAVSAKPSSISLRRSARKRKMGSDDVQEDEEIKKVKVEEKDRDDKEFDVEKEGSDASDDETTIAKEEEEHVDHGKEIADLQAESEMPLEDLMKMYSGAFDADEPPEADKDEEMESLPASPDAVKEESSSESEDEGVDDLPEEEEIGMDYLFKSESTRDEAGPMIMPSGDEKTDPEAKDGSPSKEITDVAAEAASLQPTGFTLATTQVVTPIPVLLKHTLREYQHIGLDWLVTMYDKRLNGILADEMGLGKTIQTIALLAHLACDKGVWGPHLIVVPTSVMLNWEMEFKKWCPGFKILTYYGSQKERKAKRTGWTKSNAFHVCITSYKLVLQDNTSFRRKKWKYLILDEAQNIKNFKSQRWQTLLNFNSQRRLLLTGTPLQNNLMELWSLMHFLMPHVFQSHKEFKEWFSNPLTGMIEGGQEYNEKLVKRLHKVLRPFLLRRIKKDVEKQMPNKYEHVVRCHLSKRQRFLYDDFMSQASTKDTLQSGHFMSVINILMQLRKVCNHPNLFEPRAIVSPFFTDQMHHRVPSLVTKVSTKSPFETLNLQDYQMHLPSLTNIRQTHAELLKKIQTPRKLIEELPGGVDVALEREDSKVVGVREQLATLLKEREKVGKSQPANSLPVLTIPITSGTNSLQITPACGPARVITIPQSKTDDSVSKASQAFALQYQTVQGTRVAIPNKQIRQLAGGVVKIVTPSGTKSQASVSAVSANATQNGPSLNSGEADNKGDCEMLDIKDPTAYVECLEKELQRDHRRRCLRMAAQNERRCQATSPWLPQDTVDFLKNIYKRADEVGSKRIGVRGSAVFEMIKSADRRLNEMKPVTDRFTFVIPLVEAKPIDFHVSHPDPSQKVEDERRRDCLQVALKRSWNRFHSIDLSMRIQFPEARLIQYDCGKLQVLDVLLRRFWTEKHKCLIFTQMTKVLDILEAFLSYHGYRYLRLDGSTRVEQRMLLMERFNNDPKIFCFILSTRSGGIGVNLTGADTVIFYDSDWNPTMDAQAQDRCHRIGQTRDVHIYRLISERTVEENILKKANQKRLLGNIAIEGGSFTTAFFKDNALKDLFNEPTGLEEAPAAMEKKTEPTPAVLAKPITARQKALAAAKESEAKQAVDSQPPQKEASWEEVLQQTEDKEDVDAAKQLREEQDADMDEFTENVDDETAEGSKIREEMKSIYEELTPIEKYALRYLEETTEEMNREELELAEEEVHKSKQDWELAHLVALKEEEERRLEEEEDEIFYTREDAENQMYVDDATGERMPIWFPPTPPQDDNDVYIDPITVLLYIPGAMPDDLLPVVQVKKDRKRPRTDSENPAFPSQRRKMSRVEHLAPKSLFNRQSSKKREKAALKIRKEQAALAQKGAARLPSISAAGAVSDDKDGNASAADKSGTATTQSEPINSGGGSSKNPEWLMIEDCKLLQAVQQVLEMPLSLSVMMPAHTPNWDVVADMVNAVSSTYRSPKMCKQRFENQIAPREEGKSALEVAHVKKKGTKTPTKPKSLKVQKGGGLQSSDNNAQCSSLYMKRFNMVREICGKRSTPVKSSGANQFQRNPAHTAILMDNGIDFDKPFTPEYIASMRANRIQREKEAAKQQMAQSQTMHSIPGQQVATAKQGISSLGQLTAIPLSGSSTANIIVNTSAFKKINQQSKTTIGTSALQQTLLRTASTGDQQQLHQSQIHIQPGQAGATVVSVGLLQRLSNPVSSALVTAVAGNSSAITLSSLTRPSISGATVQGQSSQQLTKQLTKQQQQRLQQQMLQLQKQKKTPKAQVAPQKVQMTSEMMKKLKQQRQQQLEANVLTVTKVGGKARKHGAITQQELESILKSQSMRRTIGQKTQSAQVHIAPVHAQVQAQQVQEAAAQQAAQHGAASKPLPITVPVSSLVSAVNIGGMSMSLASAAGTSTQGKSLVMTNAPANIQQHLQRQLLKHHRIVSQQGQTQQQTVQGQVLNAKVGGKQTVYAMVAAGPQLVQNKRRVNVAASAVQGTSNQAQAGGQPVLTVTKLLHAQAMPGQTLQMKQPAQGSETLVQQVRHQAAGTQQLQVGQATIIPSSGIAQQRLITPQRQIRQLPQPTQMILTPASGQQFLQRQGGQNIVASLSISAAPSTAPQQMTLSSVTQSANLTQQFQNLINSQVIRASAQNAAGGQTTLRNVGQHLVLQPQRNLAAGQQATASQVASSVAATNVVPSLVLPASVVSAATTVSRSQVNVGDVASVQFVPKSGS